MEEGGGGGGGVAPPAVPLEFLKHPILRETPTGNPVLTDITMKNPTSKNASVSISLDGVPTNWVQEVQSAGIIPPGQTKTETLAITVPKNADPGDYLVGMNVNTGGTSGKSKFVLRVKEYPEEYRVPQVYTAVDVDFADNTSNVKLSVQNNQVFRQSVFIYQTIPKSVAKSTDEIDFQTAPTKIINNEPVVLWILQDVQQNQKQDLSYDVKSIVSEYEPYVYYLSNEVVAISVRQEDYIKITNVFSSPLVAGVGNNYVNVELTNTYTNPINVSASLFTIQRWSIAPEEAQIMINPRATETVRFNVTVPPETKSGTYAGSIFLRYQNVTTSKDISLVVGVGVQIGVLGFDIIYWVILIGILILLASYIISKRVYGKEFMKYTSREDRFKVLKDIRDIIKRK